MEGGVAFHKGDVCAIVNYCGGFVEDFGAGFGCEAEIRMREIAFVNDDLGGSEGAKAGRDADGYAVDF